MAHPMLRDSGNWTAIYVDVDGTRKSAGTYSTKAEAKSVAEAKEAYVRGGLQTAIDPEVRASMTVARYFEDYYLTSTVVGPSTKSMYRTQMKLRVGPRWGDVRLLDVERAAVRRWLGEMAEAGVPNPTRRASRAAFSAIMEMATLDEWVPANAVQGTKLPKSVRKDITVLTQDQFKDLYEGFPTRGAQLMAWVFAASGVRLGELTELRAKDVNVQRRSLRIERRVTWPGAADHPEGVSGPHVLEGTKNLTVRTLGIQKDLAEALGDWIQEQELGKEDLLFAAALVKRPRKRQAASAGTQELTKEFVMTLGLTEPLENGKQWHHGTASAYTKAKCKCNWCRQWCRDYERRAGRRRNGRPFVEPTKLEYTHISKKAWYDIWEVALAYADLPFRFTTHHLRHTHASWLMEKQQDPFAVMRRLGQKDISTTQLYVHATRELDHGVADSLGDIFA